MKTLSALLNTNWKTNLVLFLCSLGIYFLYFHHVFLNINSILCSITLDSLKNYYTYAYHIKNDASALHFSGLNYPFGEHVIYTDCQPIFTFILRLMPFMQDYLIGTMHALMFFSFIITPLILNRILRILELDKFTAFFISLGIALLSPQFLKINGGHFALAYGCLVPLSILFILQYLKAKSIRPLLVLFEFNTLLFLLHPYLGFCLSLFSFLALFFFELFPLKKEGQLLSILKSTIPGILPLILFKGFMLLTDTHANRTVEPFGAEMMVENLDSILSPVFGPFQSLMERFFPDRAFHFEGHSYLGFFTIVLSLLFVLSLPFTFKKIRIKKEMLGIFLSAFLFLLIAFGIHLKLFAALHLKSASLNQFRAVCRFAWIFYFALPLFVIPPMYHLLKQYLRSTRFRTTAAAGSMLFFAVNVWEAHYFFTMDNSVYWKYTNFFRKDLLNEEEKTVLENTMLRDPQAILPLPVYHGGSEMYDRVGSSNSMLPSMIYSYHSGIPIFSTMLSRTSITETEEMLQMLNSYKKDKPAVRLMSTKDFLVIITKDSLMPDEKRLSRHIRPFETNDSLKFGYISFRELLSPKKDKESVSLNSIKPGEVDSNSIVYISTENRKPFTGGNIKDYETIFVLDSNKIKPGPYIVSFHYYYTQKTYRSLACDLIVTRANASGLEWQYTIPVRYLSGIYNGYGIFEFKIDLNSWNKYEFILKGHIDQPYRVSDFMLRPENKMTFLVTSKKDTVFNNFPPY